MRILFWQELFWPYIGGVEVLATKLLLALRQRGHEITVVTRRDRLDLPKEAQYQGIQIYRYPFPWTAFAKGDLDQLIEIRQQVARLKRTFRPDLVHMNCFGPSFLFYHDTTNGQTAPLLATLHTTPQSVMPQQAFSQDGLFRRTLRMASWVSCVSTAVLADAHGLVPEITSYSSVIYNGLEVPSVPPKPLPFDPPKLLCLGRLIPEKGFDLALKAFALIADCFPRARLVIAGDGPARSFLENQVAELGLRHSVEFVGWVPPEKVPSLLNAATVVIMPSHREGLPSVALEAALMARPVVATRVGGLPEVVLHQKTGLLVDDKDQEALAEAMLFLLNHPDTATALGVAARRRAQEVFSFERYVSAYDTLYKKLVIERDIANDSSSISLVK
jgi:glycosyltransferase involved in cell wall biosynthesis